MERTNRSSGQGTQEAGLSSLNLGLVLLAVVFVAIPIAVATGIFDPSLPTGPYIGDLPPGLPDANLGAFEGGLTGTHEDAGANNAVPFDQQQPGDGYNIPTNSLPSPLFGAEPFTQQMLRFEEFGTEPMPSTYTAGDPFPGPKDAQRGPRGNDLDAFLAQAIYPEPTRLANTTDENPWKADIENFLGRTLDTPPAEGRPSGEGWAHQRWDEFPPQVYFKTCLAGARVNGGLRDSKQDHGYALGEFGPGGLYHNTVGVPGFEGTTAGIPIALHPNMPVQEPEALWTFDGTLPPKLLKARYGETILLRNYNALPIDPAANMGFGIHTISTHEHNGHSPAESDGYTNAFFFPGQYYDYRWPLQLASRDTVNTDATDPRAGSPDGNGGIIQIPGDYRETMSTHWFHDHMLDFTAQNVYKGNAVMMNYYSAIDRGNEALDDGVNLRLPSGTALDWGNRDYDVQLLVADKAWDQDGQLWFNIFNLNGFLGDRMTVNWLWKPTLEVRARRYRFRILNGAVSRYFKIALVKEVAGNGGAMPGLPGSGVSYDRVPFHLIANDGNIMEHAVAFDGTLGTEMGVLPTQSIAERYDIIVDFANFQPGDKLYFVNTLDHKTGRGVNDIVALEDVLSGAYEAVMEDTDGDGVADRWAGGDPCVGKFLELHVREYNGTDLSMDPADYVAGGQTMIELPARSDAELANALHRTFTFGLSNGTDSKPWTIKTDGGIGLNMDPRRLSAAPNIGDLTAEGLGHLEIWHIVNGGNGWSHPVHIHFEEGTILARDGQAPPEWEKWARKDMYRIGPEPESGGSVDVAIRFREFAGTYMEHCHNTQHEDNAMLMRYDIEHPGQFQIMPAPIPTWEGVGYVDTVALPTFRTGDNGGGGGGGGNGGGGNGGGGVGAGSGTGGGPCLPEGEACTTDAECCFGRCRLRQGAMICAQ
ncbi:MAG: multicopper oxidase domain-containing protein [Phycisphaerae bacterium]